jgi:hypothetical protein
MARVPSFLATDPDERVVRWGWMLWVLWGVIGGGLLLADRKSGALGFALVLTAPFWGVWLLWPLYRGLRVWASWLAEGAWSDWQGDYFEFDGRQIRILFAGDAVWFVAADVFDALGITGHQRNPERVRQVAGRDGLAVPPSGRLLAFSEVGLRAWLDRRTDLTAHKFRLWVDKQVLEPYRRRREFGVDSGIGGGESSSSTDN